jgi:hypothetical protein
MHRRSNRSLTEASEASDMMQQGDCESEADEVFARLTALGWFEYIEPSDVDEVRTRFRDEYVGEPSILAPEEEVTGPSGGSVGLRGIDRRSCFVDPEDLAEGNISSVFLLLRDSFAHEGVHFREIRDDLTRCGYGGASEDGYALVIDSARHVLFETLEYGWADAVERTLALANELFERAGSCERLYSFVAYENDGWMILLSPEQLAYVKTLPISPRLDVAD